jgi:hypothetical protein
MRSTADTAGPAVGPTRARLTQGRHLAQGSLHVSHFELEVIPPNLAVDLS